MRIILLGPPGSGKGTQGALIEQRYGFPEISTGDLLRLAVQKKSPMGMQAKAAMDKGDLVNDDIVLQLVAERMAMEDCNEGYVLDGFPRNMKQALMLEKLDCPHEVVLDIRLEEETLISRLSSRRICARCGNTYNLIVKPPGRDGSCDKCQGELVQRLDDEPAIIQERLKVYHQETEPLVVHYRNKEAEIKKNRQTEAVL
jgi:adenylate kinase